MSFYVLDGNYSVDRERTVRWIDTGTGVSLERIFKWSLLSTISNEWILKWNVLYYVSREFTYIWRIIAYVARDFTYAWRVALDFSAKMKHEFGLRKAITRIMRRKRDGG